VAKLERRVCSVASYIARVGRETQRGEKIKRKGKGGLPVEGSGVKGKSLNVNWGEDNS